MSDEIRNRYRGIGGLYAVVNGEVVPADEQGNPLPHTRNEDGTPIAPPEPPVPSEPAGPDAPVLPAEPQE